MGSERVNREIREFLEAERKQEQASKDKAEKEAELERIQKDLALTHGKLIQTQKQITSGVKDHPYVSPTVLNIAFKDEEEKAMWQAAECRAFRAANRDWDSYNSDDNIELLFEMYANRYLGHGACVVDRDMLAHSFNVLKSEGLINPVNVPVAVATVETLPATIEEPELQRLPEGSLRPANGLNKRDTSGQTDVTGKFHDDLSISKMTAEEYRKHFMPVTTLGRFSFGGR